MKNRQIPLPAIVFDGSDLSVFSPIQGLWTRSVRLSVWRHDNSFQTQHIDLKLSTHLFEVKSGDKFEDEQNRNKFFFVMRILSKPMWGKK